MFLVRRFTQYSGLCLRVFASLNLFTTRKRPARQLWVYKLGTWWGFAKMVEWITPLASSLTWFFQGRMVSATLESHPAEERRRDFDCNSSLKWSWRTRESRRELDDQQTFGTPLDQTWCERRDAISKAHVSRRFPSQDHWSARLLHKHGPCIALSSRFREIDRGPQQIKHAYLALSWRGVQNKDTCLAHLLRFTEARLPDRNFRWGYPDKS